MADPISTAYAGIVSSVTGSAAVAAIVAADNMVDNYSERPPGIEDMRQPGDLPALLFTPANVGEDNLWNDVDEAQVMVGVNVQLVTGDERIGEILLPLRYAILRGLYSSGVTLGGTVHEFRVSSFGPISPAVITDDGEVGWQATLTISARIFISHSTLEE